MCVHCELKSPTRSGWVRWYLGGWRNFIPRGKRGEGNPPPWIMLRLGRWVGFEFQFHPPALFKSYYWRIIRNTPVKGSKVIGVYFGMILMCWLRGEA